MRRKGGSPVLAVMAVIGIGLVLHMLSGVKIYQRNVDAGIADMSAYSSLHQMELFKRTIDSSAYFTAVRNTYDLGGAGNEFWTSTTPADEELRILLEAGMANELFQIQGEEFKLYDFVEVFAVPEYKGEVSLTIKDRNFVLDDVSEEGFSVNGSIPFKAQFVFDSFFVNMTAAGKFSRYIPTSYFKIASLMRETADSCPLSEGETIIDSRFNRTISIFDSTTFEVSIVDMEDSNPFDDGNLNITAKVDCSNS